MNNRILQLFALLALVTGCQPSMVPPSIDEIAPNWGFNGDETPVALNGTNLFPGVEAKGGTIDGFNRDFMAFLDGPASTQLTSVRLNSDGNLSAIVPRGLPIGWYDLEVRTPAGERSTLDAAFEVTDTRADHIRLTVDTNTHQVRDFAILRASIRDPTGDVVVEPSHILVSVQGGSETPASWTFDYGDVANAQGMEDGTGFSGTIRPSGEVYFGFQSDVPGDFRINIEAQIRDRISLQSSALVQFQTGDVDRLSITAVEHSDTRRAGEPFDVDLRLTDQFGNTVSGVVATVALSEACTGGQFQEIATFVDDARVTVTPTKACNENQILGFGVVEGQSISGESQPFTMVGGALSTLDVRVTPTSISAGTEEINVWIQAQDDWQNSVWDDPGPIELQVGGTLLDESLGTGTFFCSAATGGTASCTAALFQTGDAVSIRAVSTSGALGNGNPIVVQAGPAAELLLRSTSTDVVAGVPFPLSLSALDRFGNRLALSPAELDESEFYDLHGPIECAFSGAAPALETYDFDCTATVADTGNELRGLIPSFGADGVFGPFDVHAGELTNIWMNLIGGAAEAIEAGETFSIDLEGSDDFGNLVEGPTVLEIDDLTASITPTEIVLDDGIGRFEFQSFSALKGNSVWAWSDGKSLGGTNAFDVVASEPDHIWARFETPWGFSDSTLNVDVAIADRFGNPTNEAAHTLTLVADTIMYADTPVRGKHTFTIPTGTAGIMDPIVITSGEWALTTEAIPIGNECTSTTGVYPTVSGPESGRFCLSEDGTGEVNVTIPAEAAEWVIRANSALFPATDSRTTTLSWAEPGAIHVESFIVDTDLCGWTDTFALFGARDGELTGEMSITTAGSLLTAGATDEYAATEVWIQGRTCSGDLAAGSEVIVQPMLGTTTIVEDTSLTAPETTDSVVLNDAGEASFFWSMSDENQGGIASLFVGTADGRAFGARDVTVMGDARAPTIQRVAPNATSVESFDLISIHFSEAMLNITPEVMETTSAQIFGSDGHLITISDRFWTDEQRVLNLVLLSEIDPSSGSWQVVISDELRDLAGNRLDGDWDGLAGGDWSATFNPSATMDGVLENCSVSKGWIVTSPFYGSGAEHGGVSIHATASSPSMWWSMQVRDDGDALIHHWEFLRSGLTESTLHWDGRKSDGHVAPNGIFTATLTPLNESRVPGHHCSASFILDNALEPLAK